MSNHNTVIVGAGPYGLSIAEHLKAARIPFQILGTPLESWRAHMPQGMRLRSEPFASNLWDPERRYTVERFSAEKNVPYRPMYNPLSLDFFLEYTEWFRRNAVGEVQDVKVQRIRRQGRAFTLELVNGATIEAGHVILATGHMAFLFIPSELAHLPKPLCLHSSQIHDLRPFLDRDVTVIGAGQAALETAALLREQGTRVRLVARTSELRWSSGSNPNHTPFQRILCPDAGLGHGWGDWAVSELPQVFRRLFPMEKRHRFVASSWGPSGAWWLRNRIEGRIETRLRTEIRSARAEGKRVRLTVEGPDGPDDIMTDHIIAATGFEVDLDRLDYLDPALKASIACDGKVPHLDPRFETSVPGLFIVGIASAPTFGPVMRFMFGAKHVAPVLARRLRSTRASAIPVASRDLA